MAARTIQPNSNQPSLFDVQQPVPDGVMEMSPEAIAPAVDIASHNSHLQAALGHIAQANMRAGFAWASETPHRSAIESRYGKHTPGMLEGAEYNRKRAYEHAKTEFAFAFGKMAMLDAGISREEVDAMIDDAFDTSGSNERSDKKPFLLEYADTKNKDEREAYRKQLRKADRIAHGKRR
jgi:hypothetical protein